MTAATIRSTRREPVSGHVRPEDFRHSAACRSVDPEIFFPTAVAGREFEAQVSVAKTVCAGCIVRSDCLTWALSLLPDGIAGGMTEHERRREQARRRWQRRPARRAPQRPAAGTRAEIAAAGQAAIAAGLSVREVAGEFLVSPRTAGRWARAVHAASNTAEGSAGGNRAPLLISTQHNTQAGTRTTEGLRG